MSILIKGLQMPANCRDCGIEQEGFWCGALDGYQNTRCFTNERREDCPLIELPPHGRLIDADELLEHQWVSSDWCCGGVHEIVVSITDIEDAPSIIEAEKTDMDSFTRIFEEYGEEDGMDSFIRILKD